MIVGVVSEWDAARGFASGSEVEAGARDVFARLATSGLAPRLGPTRTPRQAARRAPSPAERALKRAMDVVIAAAALVALSGLLAAAMAMIRLDTPGRVLFPQPRGGLNGRSFRMLKMRSMHAIEDDGVLVQARPDDPRVTRVGAWLRRTSIDELPQLWNVLKGEMSLVGPRPHALSHDARYGTLIADYAARYRVKPGLTGLAQVSGHRGATPDVATMAARVACDLHYIEEWSLTLDLRIIGRTVVQLIGQRAY